MVFGTCLGQVFWDRFFGTCFGNPDDDFSFAGAAEQEADSVGAGQPRVDVRLPVGRVAGPRRRHGAPQQALRRILRHAAILLRIHGKLLVHPLWQQVGTGLSLPMGHDPSWVGQVGPVVSCGQVCDLDPSLVKSCNLSRVGQVRPANSCGQVRNIDPSGSK